METTSETRAQGAASLTASAASHVKTLLSQQPESPAAKLRVYVESGGCSGMRYGIVFDEQRADDLTAEFFGVTVLVDPFSANYLHGAVVDYVEAATGGGFKITNPSVSQTCGCGKSFQTAD